MVVKLDECSAFDEMKQNLVAWLSGRVGKASLRDGAALYASGRERANHARHYSRSHCCHSNTWNFMTLDWWFRLKKGLLRLPRRYMTLSSTWITWVMPANYGGRVSDSSQQRRRSSPTAANTSGRCCISRHRLGFRRKEIIKEDDLAVYLCLSCPPRRDSEAILLKWNYIKAQLFHRFTCIMSLPLNIKNNSSAY